MSARSLLIHELACIACEFERVQQPSRTEEHHLNLDGKAGQKRRGEEFSIPLCKWHHVGDPPKNMTADHATYVFGPSLARSSRMFRFTYGSDDSLLALTNQKLKAVA